MDMKPLFSSQCLLEFVFLVRGYGSALRQRGLGYEALEIESARNRSVLTGFDGFHLANPVGLIFGKTGGRIIITSELDCSESTRPWENCTGESLISLDR